MCGIAGILVKQSGVDQQFYGAIDKLIASLRHRGPDGEGRWTSESGCVALAHTRLAIQDVSPSGAQPMLAQGRALVFNGEIYNHRDLRGSAQLSSSGDAATLLHLLAAGGERALPRLQGMFALALCEPDGSLLLARDPFGQKPLYFVSKPGLFAFASETRALTQTGLASSRADDVALGALAQKGSVPGERSHLSDVRMLPAGNWLRVRPDGSLDGPHAFWKTPWEMSGITDFDEAVDALAPLLLQAARRVLLSDVPVAAFLSGGIDSTAACALLAAAGAKLKTFCVVLPKSKLDEAAYAREAAALIGADHREIAVDAARGPELVAESERLRDVPGIDGANTYIVAKSVREAGFKVAISGLGGDELFGGYPSFSDARKYGTIARGVGLATGGALKSLGRVGKALAGDAASLYCARRTLAAGYFKKHKFAWSERAMERRPRYDYVADVRARCQSLSDNGNQALEFEQRVYLHDQLLRDADQFGMACGLEIRAPFLDTDLAAACARIASKVKAARGLKGLLLAATEKAAGVKFPRAIAARKKQGFALPLAEWSK